MGCSGSRLPSCCVELIAANPTDELIDDVDRSKERVDLEFPPDVLLRSMSDERRHELTENARAASKTNDLDPFTGLLYKATKEQNHAYFDKKATCMGNEEPRKPLETRPFGPFRIPEFHEEANVSAWKDVMREFSTALELEVLNSMDFYDDQATFFDSNDEAAIYYHETLRHHLPRHGEGVGALCVKKHVDGDAAALAFTGFGAWFLKAVVRPAPDEATAALWAGREASAGCVPPPSAVAVIDVCAQAKYAVRNGYERYGAAAFFSADRSPVGVWIESEERMYTPVDGREWEFAVWRFKCSLVYQSFAVGHLVWVHWSVSNTLVLSVREALEPGHCIRKLCNEFTHGSITINQAACVKLASARGAISRIGAINTDDVLKYIDELAQKFTFATFPQMLEAKGELPEGMLDGMPMAQDGRKLWAVTHAFVQAYLSIFYRRAGAAETGGTAESPLGLVEEDTEALAFWNTARTASIAIDTLPAKVDFDALVDYLATSIFYSTAVHELLGSVNFEVSLPTTTNGRIHARHLFPKDRPFQCTVQDWYRILCVTAATTLLPVPMLIPEMQRAAEGYASAATEARTSGHEAAAARHDRCAGVYLEFVRGLTSVADEIEAANETREMPFGSFNPRRLEVSVSL